MDLKSKIILISGPTASGKSDFAVKLAKKIKGEIINADSMQVYKELRVLTSRPLKIDQKNIKHHLYGFQNVNKKFSTGRWLNLALKKINQIKLRKKTPILVGGTGLYFKSITEGLVKIPNIPIKTRKETAKLQSKLGQKIFYKKLIDNDPKIKKLINSNDVQRSIRAYEVKKYTKKSLVDWFKKTKKHFGHDDFVKIYIDFPRPNLIKRINDRVERMFNDGAVNEVKRFLKLKVRKENSSNKVIGISDVSNYIKKDLNLAQTKERIVIKTRQYAKRQNTWARGQMIDWQKIHPKDLSLFIKKI